MVRHVDNASGERMQPVTDRTPPARGRATHVIAFSPTPCLDGLRSVSQQQWHSDRHSGRFGSRRLPPASGSTASQEGVVITIAHGLSTVLDADQIIVELMHEQVSHDLWRWRASQGRMCTMPAPYPQEFRDDVVRVARNREPGQKLAVIAKDFGISESCLTNWMRQADVEDGARPGTTREESSELRDLRRRNRLFGQENEVLRRAAAYLS